MTTIHASGTSTQQVPAELATIHARVSATSTDRSLSIADATRTHNWLVERARTLQESGDAISFGAAPISTWAQKSYAEGSERRVVIDYQTSSRVSIKLTNLNIVSAVVAVIAEAGVETSVDWSLTDESQREREREVRKAAVGEARAVADDYADALGERIVRVVGVSDAPGGSIGPAPRLRAMAAAYEAAPEVTIAEITVSATVSGVYETDSGS